MSEPVLWCSTCKRTHKLNDPSTCVYCGGPVIDLVADRERWFDWLVETLGFGLDMQAPFPDAWLGDLSAAWHRSGPGESLEDWRALLEADSRVHE